MLERSRKTRLACACVVVLAALAASPPVGGATRAGLISTLSFDGNFENGLTPWTSQGGGAQCANYGTPSKSPRLRGDLYLSGNEGEQARGHSAQFYLPADPNPSTYPLEACDLVTGFQPAMLPADAYYGLMIFVPNGWTIPNHAFYGVNIDELHMQNGGYGAPVTLQLHRDHVTLALETGGCNGSQSSDPGCAWRSNADNSGCVSTSSHACLPGYYAIPPGALAQGKWNEIIVHVRWASDTTGQIETWYRVKGSVVWLLGSDVIGYPTVQWSNATGCCAATYVDELEAYTAALAAPLSVWLDNDVTAGTFLAAAATMP
jgi:Polysaccharide lyase